MESAVRSGRTGGSAHLEQRFRQSYGLSMAVTAELTQARRRDRARHAPPARAAAARRGLGRRARVQRDDDGAASLLAPLPRPAHAGPRPADRERAAWRGCATTARGRSGSRARPTSPPRSRPTSPAGSRGVDPGPRGARVHPARGRDPEEPAVHEVLHGAASASGRGSGWRRSRPSSSSCRRRRRSRSTTSPAGRARRSSRSRSRSRCARCGRPTST